MYEYEHAIRKIQDYMDKNLPEMDVIFPRYLFDIRSYARWAANEIIERLIREDSNFPPHITGKEPMTVLEVIDEFIDDIDSYSYKTCAKGKPQLEEMLNVAYNTAKYIKCLFV